MKRRNFLKTSAASALAAPTIIPSSVLGADAPSNQITLGLIGCGGQGTGNLRNLMVKVVLVPLLFATLIKTT